MPIYRWLSPRMHRHDSAVMELWSLQEHLLQRTHRGSALAGIVPSLILITPSKLVRRI